MNIHRFGPKASGSRRRRSSQRGVRTLAAAVAVAAIATFPAPATPADEPTAREIVDRAKADHRVRDERAVADIILLAEGRPPRRRQVVVALQAGEDGEDDSVIRFVRPADIDGTALLTLAGGEGIRQYVYLPALRKTRRIAPSSTTERFAGTDFTYEDLQGEQPDGHDYAIASASERVDGHDCWKIEAVPRAGPEREASGYARRVIWVRKDHFLVVRVDYYDRTDRPLKTLRQLDWRRVGARGAWRFFKADMKDVQRDTRTLMRYAEREIEPGLPARTFEKDRLGAP